MDLVLLGANQPPGRFYRGGARIDRFRGVEPGPDYRPEDWVGSATTLAGEEALGLSALPDGTLLRAAVGADPVGWLGAEHLAAFGVDTMLLVKLLDAGQRLPVHAHPDDGFSRVHLGHRFGKAEAWYLLEGGTVHLGLRAPVSREALRSLVDAQDAGALLDLLHARPVSAGDIVFVPPGELHAIGSGVFLLELQQPEDLSILLEWDGFELDGERLGHLGLGFDIALEAVTSEARTAAEIDEWILHPADGASILPSSSDRFFRLERVTVDGSAAIEEGFAILVVERGAAVLEPERGAPVRVERGATVALPHAAGRVRLSGTATVLVCRPPRAGR
ncbi:MAG: class I mannose-6-phosphate isomerase [Microbacterium sp.]